jgi:hypothetical protein
MLIIFGFHQVEVPYWINLRQCHYEIKFVQNKDLSECEASCRILA